MRRRLPRWLAARAEQIGLGAALAVIALLVGWWAIYALRMISEVRALSEENARLRLGDDPAELSATLIRISADAERRFWMIEGESSLFVLLLLLAVTFLYLMARGNRQARHRIERQLQVTTHELKTPIAGVRMLLQTLSRGAVPEEMKVSLLAQGLEACDQLDHIAETILACQRAAAGRVQPRVISVSELVNGVLAHRAATGVPEGATLSLSGDALVHTDPDAFRVILENLLDNARKYAAGAVRLVGRSEGDLWTLTVEDDGPGLSEEDAVAIFEPFERRGARTTSHGSGLGLSLSRDLARDMGGDLRAQARPKGALFLVELPLVSRRDGEVARA